MNSATTTLLAAFLTALCVSDTSANIWTENFNTPPFTEGQTIVGINQWGTPATSSASLNGVVVEAPWDSGSSALRLKKTVKGDTSVRVMNSSFPAFTENARVTVGMAFDFPATTDTGTRVVVAFSNLSAAASPILFGIDFSSAGGLFYSGGGADVSPEYFLPKNQVKMNAVYTFTLDIDVVGRTFDITVAGTTIDDNPLFYTEKNVQSGVFGNAANPSLSLIFLENNAAQTHTGYITSLAIQPQPIPEPSAAAFLIGAGAASAGVSLRRRARKH